jgi:hypothetical protein
MMAAATGTELLPEVDLKYLGEKRYHYTIEGEGGVVNVTLHGYGLPAAYIPQVCDLLIRIPAGYPNANPDMFWTSPDIRCRIGSYPKAADAHEVYAGRNWQRWSRHLPAGSWRPGTDTIQTFLRAIRKELEKGI